MENADILRIIHDYNYNQDIYNRNMSSFIGLLRDARRERTDIFTFTPSDISALVGLFDFSNAFFDISGGSNTGLSATDIENGASVYGYQLFPDTPPHTCPITLDAMIEGEAVMKINRCGHVFKEAALRRWFEAHSHCPVCRGRVS
jgi:hypothetical protein